MAVVKMKQIKSTLAKSIAYITNPQKTRDGILVSSNYSDDVLDANLLADRMLATIDETANGRRHGGVLAHHVIQSFSPQDSARLTPQQLHELGIQFADAITEGEYQYVIATHVDREHTHNHIIICAANQLTHRKMRVRKNTLASWRAISDRLCMEHGLDVLPDRSPERKRYGISLAELYASAKGDAVKDRIRTAIDMAAAASHNFSSFSRLLPEHGVRVTVRGRHLTFLDTATGLKVRDVKLGRAYDELNIMARLGRETVTPISFNRRLIASDDGGVMNVWLPGSGRRLTVAIPVTRIINDGDTYRAYLSKTNPVVITDKDGRYSHRMDAEGLYAYFSRMPLPSVQKSRITIPELLGKSPAHHQWLEARERRFANLDELTEKLNLANRLVKRGITVDEAIAEARTRLIESHEAFQAALVAFDEETKQSGGNPPAGMVEELRIHESHVDQAAYELSLLHALDDLTPQQTLHPAARHRIPRLD